MDALKTLPMGKVWLRTYVNKLRILQYAPGSPYRSGQANAGRTPGDGLSKLAPTSECGRRDGGRGFV